MLQRQAKVNLILCVNFILQIAKRFNVNLGPTGERISDNRSNGI